jgi:hypothetical protein
MHEMCLRHLPYPLPLATYVATRGSENFEPVQEDCNIGCYNLHPIVINPKADKCGSHEANRKKPFQSIELLKL